MSGERFTFRGAVYLLLRKGNKILLLRRFNTGWMDGYYSMVSGHIDGKETIAQSMAREAREEAGVVIKPEDLKVVHVSHHFNDDGDLPLEYIDFYLQAKNWKGDPRNIEPEKCDNMQWFALNRLPKNLLANVGFALEHIKKKEFFSEFNGNHKDAK